MLTPRSTLTRRIVSALDASPSRIPVLVGGCGSGRTTLLQQLRDRVGRGPTLSMNVERTATTPERFLRALAAASPAPCWRGAAAGARAAFDATLDFFSRARTSGGEPVTFLLDEFLELRTFESFPGLRRVLHELIDGIALSGNRFVLTSRYWCGRCGCCATAPPASKSSTCPASRSRTRSTSSAWRRRPMPPTPSTPPAPCTRWPTDGRRTCARSPTNWRRCARIAAATR